MNIKNNNGPDLWGTSEGIFCDLYDQFQLSALKKLSLFFKVHENFLKVVI